MHEKIFDFWIAFSVILMISTFCINAGSIKYGTVRAFLMTYVAMIVLMQLSIHFGDIPIIKKYYTLHIFNPMSAISLILTKGKLLKISAVVYYHVLIVGLVYLTGNFIKKTDIIQIKM